MKLLTLFAILYTSCSTTLYSPRTGHRLARFEGNMTHSHYSGGGVTWDVENVDHAVTTRAAGSVIGTAGAAAMGIIMAGAVHP